MRLQELVQKYKDRLKILNDQAEHHDKHGVIQEIGKQYLRLV